MELVRRAGCRCARRAPRPAPVAPLLLALLVLVWPWRASAEDLAWEREGLEGREVRALAFSSDPSGMVALTGGAREPMPLWLRDGQGWSQPAGGVPSFILALAALLDGGVLLATGRDISDQPGVFLLSGNPPSTRRIYNAQAIGALAVAPGRGDVYAASAPWADRDAGSDLLRRDASGGGWSPILHGNLVCGQTPPYFRQVLVAPSAPSRLYALEWCFATVVRQTQLWRSDDRGQTWQVLPRAGAAYPLVGTLAVDPTDEDVLYLAGPAQPTSLAVATGVLSTPAAAPPAGVERSLDGGLTWTLKGDAVDGLTAIRTLLVDPRNPQRILAGTERNGVFFSDDHGDTWRPLPGLEGLRIWVLAIDEATGRLHAATSDGVWRTTWP